VVKLAFGGLKIFDAGFVAQVGKNLEDGAKRSATPLTGARESSLAWP